jgi:hypothetical protein
MGTDIPRNFCSSIRSATYARAAAKFGAEDEFKHIVDDFKDAHKVAYKPLSQIRHKEVNPIFSHAASTASQIPSVMPMHPENPWNPNNKLSPIKINQPKNINNPGHPLNRNNPINRNSTKK